MSRTELGPYTLVARIGEGGMGAVYRALDPEGHPAAVKVLKRELAVHPEYRGRFLREARIALRLRHPHIVRALDAGEADEQLYIASELILGGSVADLLARRGRIEERRALQIMRGVLSALEHAHELGLIHRDVKPENILLTRAGVPKLADLGLARGVAADATRFTRSGEALGTPSYLAPEQARGEVELDIRCDLYAVGATLFELLTGEPPFSGGSYLDVIQAHIYQPVPDPSERVDGISLGTRRLVTDLLQKQRHSRPPDPTTAIARVDLLLEEAPDRVGRARHERPDALGRRLSHTRKEGGEPEAASHLPTAERLSVQGPDQEPLEPTREEVPPVSVEVAALEPTREDLGGLGRRVRSDQPTREEVPPVSVEVAALEPTREQVPPVSVEAAADEPTREDLGGLGRRVRSDQPTRDAALPLHDRPTDEERPTADLGGRSRDAAASLALSPLGPGAPLGRLVLEADGGPWERLFLLAGDQAQLGRNGLDRSRNDLTVRLLPGREHRQANMQISGVHLRLQLQDGAGWVTDLGSANGTSVDGVPAEPHAGIRLGPGAHVLELAGVLSLGIRVEPAPPDLPVLGGIGAPLGDAAAGALELWRRENRPEHAYALLGRALRVGEAVVVRFANGLYLWDPQSVVTIEGRALGPHRPLPLATGRVFRLGMHRVQVREIRPEDMK